jgi:hypothetical protein
MSAVVIPSTPTSSATTSGAPTEYNCSLRHLDGTVRVTVIALSVVIGLLAILLLWSCCAAAVPDKKKKVERTKMTVVKSFKSGVM